MMAVNAPRPVTKKCRRCGRSKPLNQFHKHSGRSTSGQVTTLRPDCKRCRNQYEKSRVEQQHARDMAKARGPKMVGGFDAVVPSTDAWMVGARLTRIRHMMATKALAKLGDISRDQPNLCVVSYETDTEYIGSWVEGFGFFHVKFPKATTRPLTDEEFAKYNGRRMAINSTPLPNALEIQR